jgi:prolyl-tRNA synthetase
VVVVPIYRSDEDRARVLEVAHGIARDLGETIRIHVDDRDTMKPGAKYYEWEAKGVPLRLEVGPRDVDQGHVMTVRRDRREKEPVALDALAADLPARLETIQAEMLAAARDRREANSHRDVTSYDRLREIYEGDGGFVYAGWCGGDACEERVKADTKATIRVIPDEEFRQGVTADRCVVCGESASHVATWARAY